MPKFVAKPAGSLSEGDVVSWEGSLKTIRKATLLKPVTDIILLFWKEGGEEKFCVNKQLLVRIKDV